MDRSNVIDRRGDNIFGICIFLLAAVWVVFGKTLGYGFVNFDDGAYVYENAVVRSGLNFRSVAWAFTHTHGMNWHPLTTLSLLLDSQLYGLNAGGFHCTNVVLHAATVVLLFLVLQRTTGALWPSALAALIFAVHPLRAESVAWISERKDVLSGLFFMLTLWAYARFGELSETKGAQSKIRYAATLFFFVCGLLSKPMLVTLPLVLLLLDYWPLRRWQRNEPGQWRRLLVEKIPFFVLSAAICAVTMLVQAGAAPITPIPFSFRFANAIVSVATYLDQFFYPAQLAAYYPLSAGDVVPAKLLLSLSFLIALSVLGWSWAKSRPYFLAGWLWFCLMLLPVLGLAQVGGQAHADRYTYLPEIGLSIAFTWLVFESLAATRARQVLRVAVFVAFICGLMIVARAQAGYWQDSGRLWNRTLDCTKRNAVAEQNLADFLLHQGQYDEAVTHATKAIEIDPRFEEAENCIGLALFSEGRIDDAIIHYERALKIKGDYLDALNNLGQALLERGNLNGAIQCFEQALKLPGSSAFDEGQLESNLGAALLSAGLPETAVTHLERAVELDPVNTGAMANLAWLLATSPADKLRNGARAVELAEQARKINGPDEPRTLNVLAAAYAEAGRFSEANSTAQAALQLATTQVNAPLADLLQKEIAAYSAGRPYRDAR